MCGDVLSTCVHCLSNIVLKEDGAGNVDEELLVSNYFSQPLFSLYISWVVLKDAFVVYISNTISKKGFS